MARRKNTEETTVEAAEVETPTEENTVTENVTEEATEAPAEVVIDLSDFTVALEAGADSADKTTGTATDEAVAELNRTYRDLEGPKAKAAARTLIDERMKHALTELGDIVRTKAFVNLRERLVASGGGSSTPKAPADPTDAFVAKVTAVVIAKDLIQTNVPEGVSEDWADRVKALLEDTKGAVAEYQSFIDGGSEGDAPEVPAVVRQAFKVAATSGKGASASRIVGGPRRNVVTHIEQVFADLPSGSFLTVAEIAKAKSTEYGDDLPSAGAISSRLFPKDKEPLATEVFVAQQEEGKPKGAVKL